MSYLTYIMFTLKLESVTKNTIFGLKMRVKSGLEKFILKSGTTFHQHFYAKNGIFGYTIHFYGKTDV